MRQFNPSPRTEKIFWTILFIFLGAGSFYIMGNFIVQGTLQLADRQQATPTPHMQILGMQQDLIERMRVYDQEKGRWPGEGADAFSNLGLDAEIYAAPLQGLSWQIRNDRLELTNVPGDGIHIYVASLKGEEMLLYDGWSILCPALEQQCYYHSVASGNEVDLNSLRIVQE